MCAGRGTLGNDFGARPSLRQGHEEEGTTRKERGKYKFKPMKGWMEGRTDGRTDGWMDAWMDDEKSRRRKERE